MNGWLMEFFNTITPLKTENSSTIYWYHAMFWFFISRRKQGQIGEASTPHDRKFTTLQQNVAYLIVAYFLIT
jgi:hypothetical protein